MPSSKISNGKKETVPGTCSLLALAPCPRFDLSESRVSQMHSSIVARLQQQLSKRRPEFSN
jgi:hypothetical protein